MAPRTVILMCLAALAAMVTGCAGKDTASTSAPTDLCELLGPSDFAAVGVTGAGAPSSNSTPPTDYYCVYAGRSSFTGGIEFDAFLSPTPEAATAVFETVVKEGGQSPNPDRGPELGADQAVLATDSPGDPGPVATIAVRKGKLVFSVGFPSGPQAEDQLLKLARVVLERAAGIAQ